MTKIRMSIDVSPEFHKIIKTHASLKSETIKTYVIEALKSQLSKEKIPNELTNLAFEDSQNNKNLSIHHSLPELYKKLGI